MAVREINDKADGIFDELLPGVTLRLAARAGLGCMIALH